MFQATLFKFVGKMSNGFFLREAKTYSVAEIAPYLFRWGFPRRYLLHHIVNCIFISGHTAAHLFVP